MHDWFLNGTDYVEKLEIKLSIGFQNSIWFSLLKIKCTF